jgi:hypothetical protein
MQLVAAHIHGVDLDGTACEQDFRKPAGGGADVQRHAPLGRQVESFQRRHEFQGAAGDVVRLLTTASAASSATSAPGFEATAPPTVTQPRRTRSAARAREGASPSSTKR